MFFNEDLYLEDAEMTQDEIEEAAEEAIADAEASGEEPVSEGYMLYEEGLNFEIAFNESYYNLREKMMNIEHIASLKEASGLVSESEMILQEAENSFMNKLKELFGKVKEKITALFNKFVNFVSGIIDSIKGKGKDDKGEKSTVDPRDIKAAFDASGDAGRGQWTANIYQIEPKVVLALGDAAIKFNDTISNVYKNNKNPNKMDNLKSIARNMSKKKGSAEAIVASAFLTPDEYSEEILVKKPTKLTPAMVEDRVDYVDRAKEVIAKTKKAHDSAQKTIDDSIKIAERRIKEADVVIKKREAQNAEYKQKLKKDMSTEKAASWNDPDARKDFEKREELHKRHVDAMTNAGIKAKNNEVESENQKIQVLKEVVTMVNKGFNKIISVQTTYLKECKSLRNLVIQKTRAIAPGMDLAESVSFFDRYFS